MKTTKTLITFLWTSVLLSACAFQDAPVLQRTGPTTLEIYSEHMDKPATLQGMAPSVHVAEDVDDTTADLAQFPRRLRNPTLHMYVFPHLATADQVPIPGYWTVFQLYKQNHYALPGER